MSTKQKSTNSLTKLLEKSKNTITNIYIPEYKQQEVDEKKILRPYLEPYNLLPQKTIDHNSTTIRPQNRPQFDHKKYRLWKPKKPSLV